MKKPFFLTILLCVALFYLGLFTGAANTNPGIPRVFVSKNAVAIQKMIYTWAGAGYKVQSISCQSISVSTARLYEKAEGDIILVMTKY